MKKTKTKIKKGVESFKLVRSKDLNLDHINKSIKMTQASLKRLSRLINKQPAVKFLNKQRSLIAVITLVIALSLALLPWSPNGQSLTYAQASQQFVGDYVIFLGKIYGNMVNDTLMAWGKTVYQLGNYKVALSETVQAYSAMLQPLARPFTKVFEGTGKALAVVSYTISTPARVMAMPMR
jgi:hypothetical protein